MPFTVIIPARFASMRLPGKPLLDIAGKPMIQHVWQRACESDAQRVVVATDTEIVFDACKSFGAEVCMTSPAHQSGTDRLQEVAAILALPNDAVVVNVQGDEPLIPPAVINQVAANLQARPGAGMATLAERITDIETLFNPNAVKIVLGGQGYAMYFSRAPMPWARDEFAYSRERLPDNVPFLRHIGIYAYRVRLLNDFVRWPPGILESVEKLEQLRALEQGVRIHVDYAAADIPAGVDTAEDLDA
ncbi:MAG: 3-deoxy-manno-octulosonate cytidylyltransferase (CMP-KDO synthetase), partial [Bacteroidia bacterium]